MRPSCAVPAPPPTDRAAPTAKELIEQARFPTLDSLRGVGALLVMLGHGYGDLRSGFPAVDFFFMHSGFVLAYSNWGRRERPDFAKEFAVRRLIRIYPLYLAGLLLGAAVAAGWCLSGDPDWRPRRWLLALGLGGLLLPDPLGGAYGAYPMNLPTWSLFFELAINMVFGFTRFALRSTLFILAASLPLLAAAFVLWPDGGGSQLTDFSGGFARVGYSFCAGVALSHLLRAGLTPRWSPPWWACWLAMPLLYAPVFGGHLYVALLVIVVQPVLALLFLGSRMPTRLRAAALWMGLVSYALYCVHLPVQYGLEQLVVRVAGRRDLVRYVWLAAAPVSIALAHVLTFTFDVPVRVALTAWWERHGGHRGGAQGGSGAAASAAP